MKKGLAFAFCIIVLAGCADNVEAGTTWYGQISETEFYEVVGSFQLDSIEVIENSGYRVVRDNQGRLESLTKYQYGLPIGNRMILNHSDDTTLVEWLSQDGTTQVEGPYGVWSVLVDRSVEGSIIITGRDEAGELTSFREAGAIYTYSLGDDGKSATVTFADKNQNPCSSMKFPWSIELEFNENGQIIREKYFGIDGEPIINCVEVAIRTNEYDENNQLMVTRNFNIDFEPVDDLEHISTTRYVYDNYGFLLSESYFDTFGQPVGDLGGIAEIRYATDNFGFDLEESYIGPDGRPIADPYNVATYIMSPDSIGRKIAISCYGVNGDPVEHHEGWSTIWYTYDNSGNVSEYLHLDTDSIPSPNDMGVTRILVSYDDQDLAIRYDYVDLDGTPCANFNGIASILSSRDEYGFRSERKFLNVEGQLQENSDGVAIFRWKHNRLGRELEQSYYGADGELTNFKSFDYAIKTTEFSENGDRVIKYFGSDGNPVEFFGAATEHWVHASDGSISLIRYDINGEEV